MPLLRPCETRWRNSLLYLLQGILMVITGLLALIYPALASVAIVRLLGWVLIVSGIFQGIGLIGASEVPYFYGVALRCTCNRHRRVAASSYRCRTPLLQHALPHLFHD